MSSLRAIRRPVTGDFQTAVRTVFPFHVTSRGKPTFTESNRGMRTSSKSSVLPESVYFRASSQHLPSQSGLQRAVSLANSRASRLCVHPFDPLSAPCGSHEWISKVLGFPRNLVVPELHDAYGIGRLAVICQDEFGDPKIAAANDSSDRKPFFARLTSALVLYVASTASALARLRIFQHRVLVIDAVLRFKIVGIGRGPMLIQCRTDLLNSHSRMLVLLLLIVHLEPPISSLLLLYYGSAAFTGQDEPEFTLAGITDTEDEPMPDRLKEAPRRLSPRRASSEGFGLRRSKTRGSVP